MTTNTKTYTPNHVERDLIFQTILDGVRAGTVTAQAQTTEELIRCLALLHQSTDHTN